MIAQTVMHSMLCCVRVWVRMSLVISDQHVVTFHYTLKNDDGDIIDSSEGGEPLAYLHGAHNIVSGLESALFGKSIGDAFEVTVPPEEGYGLRQGQDHNPYPAQRSLRAHSSQRE